MKKLLLTTLVAMAPLAASATEFIFTYPSNSALKDLTHGTAYTWGLETSSSGSGYGGNYSSNNSGLRYEIQSGAKVIDSATLKINNIYDWKNEATDPADALYINLLGGIAKGTASAVFDPNTSSPSSNFNQAFNPFVIGNSFNTVLDATSLAYNNLTATQNLGTNAAIGNSLLKYTGSWTKAGTPSDVSWSDPSGGESGYSTELTRINSFDLTITFTDMNETFLQNLIKNDLDALTIGLGFGPECHYNIDGSIVLTINTKNAPPTTSVPDASNTLVLLGLALVGAVGFRRFGFKRA